MAAVFDACETVWDRHYPRRDKIKPGKRCVFFKRVNRRGAAVLFHAYSYIAGLTPDQAVLDDLEESITADPIVTDDGDHVEIVERFAVIVIGEVMIIESARVSGSGPLAVHAMRDMIRRHYMAKHPNLRLEDAPTLEFRRMADLHNGVKSVTARLQSGFNAEPNTFGNALETLIEGKGFNNPKISTTIEAPGNGELDTDTVEAMLEESEAGTGLSSITIKFRDGTSLGDLLKYREKSPITVQEVRPGVPAVTEIETGIVDYLRSLAQADDGGYQLITHDGQFT
ncbi:MAG: hypothetical protein J0L89_07685 [Xanthomonadales bacterium]|nr:hypothetical protein [Xanthomonadales bacterium]